MSRLAIAVLALMLLGAVSIPAPAQIPFVKVYTDNQLIDQEYHCGAPNTTAELFVVAHNVDFQMSAIDFSISYPPFMFWLGDLVPDGAISIGNSPDGIAIAWGTCCMLDPGPSLLVLRPVVFWFGGCTCAPALDVNGYAPLGKTEPSMVRYPDFTELPAYGVATYRVHCALPVESKTWGAIKALYR